MKDRSLAALAALLASLCGACGAHLPPPSVLTASAPPPLTPPVPTIAPGERLVYRVMAGPFDAGHVVIAAATDFTPGSATGSSATTASVPPAEPPRCLALIHAHIATAGLVALLDDTRVDEDTWIDTGSGEPVRFHSRLGGDRSGHAVDAFFHPRRGAIDLIEHDGPRAHRVRQRIPGGGAALNLYSALYALRAWSLGPSPRPATLDVLARSRLWRVIVRQRPEVEYIATETGPERVLRIDGVAWRTHPDGSPDDRTAARRFRLYLRKSPGRRPVRFELSARFGTVRADLVDYRAGRTAPRLNRRTTGPNSGTRSSRCPPPSAGSRP